MPQILLPSLNQVRVVKDETMQVFISQNLVTTDPRGAVPYVATQELERLLSIFAKEN